MLPLSHSCSLPLSFFLSSFPSPPLFLSPSKFHLFFLSLCPHFLGARNRYPYLSFLLSSFPFPSLFQSLSKQLLSVCSLSLSLCLFPSPFLSMASFLCLFWSLTLSNILFHLAGCIHLSPQSHASSRWLS